MNQKDKAHWELPRVPENEFLFKPRYDVSEDREIKDAMQEKSLNNNDFSGENIEKND